MKHLLFYDGQCGLCDKMVQWVLERDDDERFAFAPLQGETAKMFLKDLSPELKNLDSLVLVENYQFQPKMHVMGKGAFRTLWLLGGLWTLVGWISFLPSFLYDWAYRLVARNRHKLFPTTTCPIPNPATEHRFLP
jgi:predicted DCC family thiol-disulfide oxidoreductase YuxK